MIHNFEGFYLQRFLKNNQSMIAVAIQFTHINGLKLSTKQQLVELHKL